jgi:hypothetical protein
VMPQFGALLAGNSSVVIYDRNVFIEQATEWKLHKSDTDAEKEILSSAVLDVNFLTCLNNNLGSNVYWNFDHLVSLSQIQF